jgi:hypothetical protein
MADSFSTTVTDWEGVEQKPSYSSKNLAESGGIYKSIREARDLVLINDKNEINIIIDEVSQDAVSSSVNNNVANIVYDYQSGSGWKLFAIRLGTVEFLKQQNTYLYISRVFSEYCITKNNYGSFAGAISGWSDDTIKDGYRINLPTSMFSGLDDTDVIYFVTGANYYNDMDFTAYITNKVSDKFDINTVNRIDVLEANDKQLDSVVSAVMIQKKKYFSGSRVR